MQSKGVACNGTIELEEVNVQHLWHRTCSSLDLGRVEPDNEPHPRAPTINWFNPTAGRPLDLIDQESLMILPQMPVDGMRLDPVGHFATHVPLTSSCEAVGQPARCHAKGTRVGVLRSRCL